MRKNALRMLCSILMLSFVLISPNIAWSQNPTSSRENANPPKTAVKERKDGPWCMHHCSSSREVTYDLSNRSYSGETVRGPVTVVAKNLNLLRYKYSANSKVTLSKPPDLWSQLTNLSTPQTSTTSPPASTDTTQGGGGTGTKALVRVGPKVRATVGGKSISPAGEIVFDKVKKADDEAVQAITRVNEATREFDSVFKRSLDTDFTDVSALVGRANTASESVRAAGQELLSFLKGVNSSSTYSGIVSELSSDSKFMGGIDAGWPSGAELTDAKTSVDHRKRVLTQMKLDFDGEHPSLIADLNTAQRDLYMASEVLESFANSGPTEPGDQGVVTNGRKQIGNRLLQIHTATLQLNAAASFLNSAAATNDQMQTALADLDPSGDKYKAFQQGQAQLIDWQKQMMQIRTDWDRHTAHPMENPDPFEMRLVATCDYAFASTKQTLITLTATDQLPDKSAAGAATVLSVTAECASPFNVSAGVAFSTIPNKEYAIHPVATPPGSITTTNQFVLTADSSFHPLVLGMVSARLCEPNEKVALHLSFGLAGNFKSQSGGGSSAEFLIGPSISLFRTMFITPGLHIGKKTVLADGFTVGSPVPPNVTTPPLQSSYKPAFGLAITFTKP